MAEIRSVVVATKKQETIVGPRQEIWDITRGGDVAAQVAVLIVCFVTVKELRVRISLTKANRLLFLVDLVSPLINPIVVSVIASWVRDTMRSESGARRLSIQMWLVSSTWLRIRKL